MEELIAHLINQVYRVYQEKLIPEINQPVNISYYIDFDGFKLSYNWYGCTRITKELVGKGIIHLILISLILSSFDNNLSQRI